MAFARGHQGPGQVGDRAIAAAAAIRSISKAAGIQDVVLQDVGSVVIEGRAGARYGPGYLAAREGSMMEAVVRRLMAEVVVPDVVLVDATGRDHPRHAGLALHLGAVVASDLRRRGR